MMKGSGCTTMNDVIDEMGMEPMNGIIHEMGVESMKDVICEMEMESMNTQCKGREVLNQQLHAVNKSKNRLSSMTYRVGWRATRRGTGGSWSVL